MQKNLVLRLTDPMFNIKEDTMPNKSVKLYHFSGLSKKSKAKAKSQWGKK